MAANRLEDLQQMTRDGEALLAEARANLQTFLDSEHGTDARLQSLSRLEQIEAKHLAYLERYEAAKQRYRETWGEEPDCP